MKAHRIAWAVAAIVAVLAFPRMCAAELVKPNPEALKTAGSKFDFALWDALVRKYVDGKGRVDYARLRANADDTKKFETLYAQVGLQKLDALKSRPARLAFLLNAYNVCVWKNVLMRPPFKDLDSKLKQMSFFHATDFVVAGQTISLDKLENEEIREKFREPRVHMALNCASGGCPDLPAEAFKPDKLTAQLEREAKKFCNQTRNVSYDAAQKTLALSHIFDWYVQDFGGGPTHVLAFINQRRAPDQQIPADVKIEYVDYDWRLNDIHLPR